MESSYNFGNIKAKPESWKRPRWSRLYTGISYLFKKKTKTKLALYLSSKSTTHFISKSIYNPSSQKFNFLLQQNITPGLVVSCLIYDKFSF